jgi:hypothetical protein
MSNSNQQGNLKQALVAGACAGTAVDTALFPLGIDLADLAVKIGLYFDMIII